MFQISFVSSTYDVTDVWGSTASDASGILDEDDISRVRDLTLAVNTTFQV